MTITIEFCIPCNLLPDAVRATEELVGAFGRDIEKLILIPSAGGCFEVTLDDHLIFSKVTADRTPETGELVSLIKRERS